MYRTRRSKLPTLIIDFAKSLTPEGHDILLAKDAIYPARQLELLLLERGFADDTAVTEDSDRVQLSYRLAYNWTLTALDLARVKLDKIEGDKAKATFRKEVDYLDKLLTRLAKRAGVDEDAAPPDKTPAVFLIEKVPFFPES